MGSQGHPPLPTSHKEDGAPGRGPNNRQVQDWVNFDIYQGGVITFDPEYFRSGSVRFEQQIPQNFLRLHHLDSHLEIDPIPLAAQILQPHLP